jgi:hypothetical protein
MENITQERLDRVIEVYKNGVANWFRDSHFLLDCAYYEGAIDRACEHLNVPKAYTHITITPQLQESYQNGYDNFWA